MFEIKMVNFLQALLEASSTQQPTHKPKTPSIVYSSQRRKGFTFHIFIPFHPCIYGKDARSSGFSFCLPKCLLFPFVYRLFFRLNLLKVEVKGLRDRDSSVASSSGKVPVELLPSTVVFVFWPFCLPRSPHQVTVCVVVVVIWITY